MYYIYTIYIYVCIYICVFASLPIPTDCFLITCLFPMSMIGCLKSYLLLRLSTHACYMYRTSMMSRHSPLENHNSMDMMFSSATPCEL